MAPLITAIVLNYNAEPQMLRNCLNSLRAQDAPGLAILVVDNGSASEPFESTIQAYPEIEVRRLGHNFGFAAGMNIGIATTTSTFVLLLNFDVELDPTCASELLKVIERDERIIGVAPKTVFMHDRHLIDNVGTLIDPGGSAYNMGIGQLDIGQYDVSEAVFGGCFAVTMLRRAAFAPGAVGPLDESYFMYYEDIDWCYRANLRGGQFRTAPRAVAAHVHSASVRHLDYSFKHYLIERNLFRTVVKNFERPRMVRVLVRRTLGHCLNPLRRRPFWRSALKAALRAWMELPVYLRARRAVQRERQVPDGAILRYGHGEAPYFDPVRYAPIYTIETLVAMYRRRFLVTGDPRTAEITAYLQNLLGSKLRFGVDVRSRLAEALRGEPPFVLDFLAKVEL